jgi:hypothetical protein
MECGDLSPLFLPCPGMATLLSKEPPPALAGSLSESGPRSPHSISVRQHATRSQPVMVRGEGLTCSGKHMECANLFALSTARFIALRSITQGRPSGAQANMECDPVAALS